jgi:hypothetical protein
MVCIDATTRLRSASMKAITVAMSSALVDDVVSAVDAGALAVGCEGSAGAATEERDNSDVRAFSMERLSSPELTKRGWTAMIATVASNVRGWLKGT